jgi:peptide/nickel transport system substrate-binding protein
MTRTRLRSLSTLFILVLIVLSCSACSKKPEDKSTIVYGLTLAPSGIDPHLNASAELGIPLSSVYDTLVFRDPETGEFVPGLAESWLISPDGLTYRFDLKQNITFHDGTDFDANAVIANIDYVQNPEHHSFKAVFMLGPLDDVREVDKHTVEFRLSEPFAPLLDSLSQVYLGMASPAALEEWGALDYQYHQVGTGPYRFIEYVPNDHLTLSRNPDYEWAPSIHQNPSAEIETIHFRFFEDPATRALALESGEIDVIGEVPVHEAKRMTAGDNFTLYPISIPGQPLQFFFNTNNAPTDEVAVREALILAVDRASIVRVIFGEYSPVGQSLLGAGTYGFSTASPFPAYNSGSAMKLLDDSGWLVAGDSGERRRDGLPFKLHIVAPPWGSNPDVAQLLRAAWEDIGAKVTLEIAPGFGPLQEAQKRGEYHAIGINFFDTDPDLLRSFYASTGLYNWSGFTDPELDDLLSQASRATLNEGLRLDLYAQIAERVREEALLLPIRDYVNLVVANNRLQGLRFSAQGWFPYLIDLSLAP